MLPNTQKARQLVSHGGSMRSAPRVVGAAVLVLSALLLTPGCSQLSTVDSIRIGNLPEAQVGVDHEWRLAWEIEAGSVAIEVPRGGDDRYLRLGVLPREDRSAPVTVRVSAGAEVLLEETAAVASVWHDRLVEIPPEATGACSVHIEAPGPVALGPCEIVPARAEKPNVLIFLIDALRLDHVGCYGYDRETTPHIDAFAEDALRFTQLMPQASWTRPSVASLLTSTYPPVHGATMARSEVNAGLPFLSARIRQAGYSTEGFVANPSVLPMWGFGRAYDRYFDIGCDDWLHSDDADVVDRVLQSLDEVKGKPWYFYVHAMGPHDPYDPPAPYDRTFARADYSDDEELAARQRALDLYDGEIRYTDVQFGRVIDTLKRLGLYDNTVVVVVSDHGEEFWEHGGDKHGETLYEEQLRIPLLVKLSGNAHAGEVLDELVEMVDIAPTVLDVLGLPPEPRFQGRSLANYIASGQLVARPGYANLELHGKNLVAVKTLRDKMIEDRAERRTDWYDLGADPGERHSLSVAPGRADLLPRHAQALEMGTIQGLHLLVTFPTGGDVRLRGQVTGEGFASHRIYAPLREARASRTPGTVILSALPCPDTPPPDAAQADYVHLFVSMRPSTAATLTIEACTTDGEALDLPVLGGPSREPLASLEAPLDLSALTAPPQLIDPAALPRASTAYLWYVMPGQQLAEDEVPEETLKALGALGYMD